jgi:hypothetical protein
MPDKYNFGIRPITNMHGRTSAGSAAKQAFPGQRRHGGREQAIDGGSNSCQFVISPALHTAAG